MAKKKIGSNSYKKDTIATKIDDNKSSFEIKRKSNPIINIFLVLSLISSISYFVTILIFKQNDLNIISELISMLLVIIFNVFFICTSINNGRKNNTSLLFSIFFLIIYNVFGIVTSSGVINIQSVNKLDDFTGRSLVDVVKWADKNDINLVQNYEYSDMVPEYHIIGQKEEVGKSIKDIDSLTVVVSEGANPNKEVIVPNMVTWNCDKVLEFIEKNKLSNVEVSFIVSDKVKDTVIEQSKSGNMARNEELKLTFSLGEGDEISDTKLSDLTNMSKFKAEFYLKRHAINYEIKREFSNKIKRDYVMAQSIKPGTVIKANSEDKVIITISRGEEIKVPNLTSMSMAEITDWVIKNRLKLEFSEKYDDSVDDNKVISANYKKGDIIEQGSLISIVISKGKIIMPGVSNLSEFKDWAEKYGINYQEEHQFSENVSIGEIISYSHKTGDVIKNNDTVTVIISDGKEIEVPNLVGMNKSDIISKLNKLNLKYSFVYKYSSSVSKDKAISQSISSGSKVSSGTTVTVTLSNGKAPSGGSSSNGGGSNNNGSSSGGGSVTPPACDKSKGSELNIQTGSSGKDTKNMISQLNPNHKFSWNLVNSCPNGDSSPGTVCVALDGVWKNYCDTISITIVK